MTDSTLDSNMIIFVMSMSVGMYIYGTLEARRAHDPDGGAGACETLASASTQDVGASAVAGVFADNVTPLSAAHRSGRRLPNDRRLPNVAWDANLKPAA